MCSDVLCNNTIKKFFFLNLKQHYGSVKTTILLTKQLKANGKEISQTTKILRVHGQNQLLSNRHFQDQAHNVPWVNRCSSNTIASLALYHRD